MVPQIRVKDLQDATSRKLTLTVVKDVYSVVPFGGQKLQLQVTVNRDRLAAYRMSPLDLKYMLDMQIETVLRSRSAATDVATTRARPTASVPSWN